MATDDRHDDRHPKDWIWDAEPAMLADYGKAPAAYGFYEIGRFPGGRFEPLYGGRAAGATLFSRLSAHYHGHGNRKVFQNRSELWHRYKVCGSESGARYFEAVHLAAVDYVWNRRMEWAQHWAMEDDLWDTKD